MSNQFTSLPPHDPRDPTLLQIAHAVLSTDDELWRRCAFVGLRLLDGGLHEARQCPQCPAVVLRPTGFAEAARSLAGRLASLSVPLSLSQAAQSLAEWASQTTSELPDCSQATNRDLPIKPDDTQVLRIPIGTSLKEAERRLILAALESCEGSRRETAHALGLSRRTLYNKLAGIRRRQSHPGPQPTTLAPSHDSLDQSRYSTHPRKRKRAAPQPNCEQLASHSK